MNGKTILIVDDSELNRRVIADILKDNYNIAEAANGIEAVDYLFHNADNVLLIILDIMMPQLNGIEVIKIIKSDIRTADIPVIMVTAADSNEEYSFKLGAVDFIKKPFNSNVVLSRVNTHINKKRYDETGNNDKWDSCFLLFTNLLYKMSGIPDLSETASLDRVSKCCHISRVFAAEVCQKLSGEYGELSKYIEKLSDLIPLRDIGKFMINGDIIRKKEQLTAEDFKEIIKHCEYGIKMLEPFSQNNCCSYPKLLSDIIMDHHENFDGTGYPLGKKGSAISPIGRIAAIIDCYMAMTEKRAYRNAFSHEETIKYIISQKNKKFDGRLVDIFVKLPISEDHNT